MVEQIPAASVDFAKLGARLREALANAQALAVRYGHGQVSPEHLLHAVLEQDEGPLRELKRPGDPTLERLKSLLENHLERLPSATATETILHPAVEALLARACRESDTYKSRFVTLGHLLLAYHQNEPSRGELLEHAGITRERIAAFGYARQDIPRVERDETDRPMLREFGRDLTALAARGLLDPVFHRDAEVRRVIQILLRRTKNNPLLVGEPGIGKTAIAEAVAQRIVHGDVGEALRNRRIVSIDMGLLLAGTIYRGMFEARIKRLIHEVEDAGGAIILFLDEAHTLVGAGQCEGQALDAADMLKPALARASVRIIGATTTSEYRRYFERDQALERRFQPVFLDEPSLEATLGILRGLGPRYSAHHGVEILDEALVAAARLSDRYLAERRLPDKAIDLLDEAAAGRRMELEGLPEELDAMERRIFDLEIVGRRSGDPAVARELAQLRTAAGWLRNRWVQERKAVLPAGAPRLHRNTVDANDVARVLSRWCGVPVARLLSGEIERLRGLEERLVASVVGQERAARIVARAIVRARTGVKAADRPVGSFLFAGPTGVGKTEMAKALARHLFDGEDRLLRIQMSELSDPGAVSRLIGGGSSAFGKGELTELVRRRPHSIVLFDEVEKAHPAVQHLLLRVLDEGRLTDAQGRTVDFRNALLILTSNLGAGDGASSIGFGESRDLGAVDKAFSRELLNRFDAVIPFRPLTERHMLSIVDLQTASLSRRLKDRGVEVRFSTEAKRLLAKRGYDSRFGARPLRRLIESEIETELALRILRGEEARGIRVMTRGDGFAIETEPQVRADETIRREAPGASTLP